MAAGTIICSLSIDAVKTKLEQVIGSLELPTNQLWVKEEEETKAETVV